MTGANKAELTDIKSYISAQYDVVRLPYRRNPETIPRRFALTGTSNENVIPNDPTGTRRFVALPVRKGRNDGLDGTTLVRQYLDEARESLWAEALYMYQSGVEARLPSELKSAQRELNEQFRNADSIIEEQIQHAIHVHERFQKPFSLADLANTLELSNRDHKRIAAALGNLGYVNNLVRMDDKIMRKWSKKQ